MAAGYVYRGHALERGKSQHADPSWAGDFGGQWSDRSLAEKLKDFCSFKKNIFKVQLFNEEVLKFDKEKIDN